MQMFAKKKLYTVATQILLEFTKSFKCIENLLYALFFTVLMCDLVNIESIFLFDCRHLLCVFLIPGSQFSVNCFVTH